MVVTVNEMQRWKRSGRGLEGVKAGGGGECPVCNPLLGHGDGGT